MSHLIRPVRLALLIACLSSLCGCSVMEAKKGAIGQEGVLRDGIHIVEPGAFPEPLVDVEPHAVTINNRAPLLEVKPHAVTNTGPLVAPEAVKVVAEKGSFVVEQGAITINVNVLPQKPPTMDVTVITDNLKTLKPIGDIAKLSQEQQQIIIDNSAKLHSAIQALIKMILDYNMKYTSTLETK